MPRTRTGDHWLTESVGHDNHFRLHASPTTIDFTNRLTQEIWNHRDYLPRDASRQEVSTHIENIIANAMWAYYLRNDRHTGVRYTNDNNRAAELRIPRYNPLGIKLRLRDACIRFLANEKGYLQYRAPTYHHDSGVGYPPKYRITIRGRNAAQRGEISINSIVVMQREEIWLRDKPSDIYIDYEETAETQTMRDEVAAYRALLQRHVVELPDMHLTASWIAQNVRRNFTSPSDSEYLYGEWGLHGRIYAIWQGIPETDRLRITLDGEAVTELDFSSMAIRTLYGMKKLEAPRDDLYALEGYTTGRHDQQGYGRRLAKTAMNIILNTRSFREAEFAVRGYLEKPANQSLKRWFESYQATSECISLPDVLAKLTTKHEPVREYFFTLAGYQTMYVEAEIAMDVVRKFVDADKPVLTIHDSFTAKQSDRDFLWQSMIESYQDVLSITLTSQEAESLVTEN